MNSISKIFVIPSIFMLLTSLTGCSNNREQEIKVVEVNQVDKVVPVKLHIIIGSVRTTQTGEKIAKNIKAMIDKRPEIKAEIIDIATYALPFYTDEISPESRKTEITDPVLKKWADTIQQADGYILISPEYNAGYPAPLKNALDSLYKEWNGKPVAFVGYSGGLSGGTSMLEQLRQVVQGLKMIPITAQVKIPQSWKAFDNDGNFVNAVTIEKEVNSVVDQLLEKVTL